MGPVQRQTGIKLWSFSCRTILTKLQKFLTNFLKRKGISVDEYIEYISIPGNRGDELALHLLCIMQGIHYCIITKTEIHYSNPTAFPSPSAVHITLVYLGNKVFCDTTRKALKPPPPILSLINHCQTKCLHKRLG